VALPPVGARVDRLTGGRQHSDARPCLVDRKNRASLDVLVVRFECPGDDATTVPREGLHERRRGTSTSSARRALLTSFAGAHAHEQGLSRHHLPGNRRR
jgi:hypothetical protein